MPLACHPSTRSVIANIEERSKYKYLSGATDTSTGRVSDLCMCTSPTCFGTTLPVRQRSQCQCRRKKKHWKETEPRQAWFERFCFNNLWADPAIGCVSDGHWAETKSHPPHTCTGSSSSIISRTHSKVIAPRTPYTQLASISNLALPVKALGICSLPMGISSREYFFRT